MAEQAMEVLSLTTLHNNAHFAWRQVRPAAGQRILLRSLPRWPRWINSKPSFERLQREAAEPDPTSLRGVTAQ